MYSLRPRNWPVLQNNTFTDQKTVYFNNFFLQNNCLSTWSFHHISQSHPPSSWACSLPGPPSIQNPPSSSPEFPNRLLQHGDAGVVLLPQLPFHPNPDIFNGIKVRRIPRPLDQVDVGQCFCLILIVWMKTNRIYGNTQKSKLDSCIHMYTTVYTMIRVYSNCVLSCQIIRWRVGDKIKGRKIIKGGGMGSNVPANLADVDCILGKYAFEISGFCFRKIYE